MSNQSQTWTKRWKAIARTLATKEGRINLEAFLKIIRYTEFYPNGGKQGDHWTLTGGRMFDGGMADHPRIVVTGKVKKTGKVIKSTAAGAYQILEDTWDEKRKELSLSDFGPNSQKQVAIALIFDCGALDLIRQGKIEEAIPKLKGTWTSLPGATENQKGVTVAKVRQQFNLYKKQEEAAWEKTSSFSEANRAYSEE